MEKRFYFPVFHLQYPCNSKFKRELSNKKTYFLFSFHIYIPLSPDKSDNLP